MLPPRFCLLIIIGVRYNAVYIGAKVTQTELYHAASHDISSGLFRESFWAETVLSGHLFMCRTPMKMVFTETSLVDMIETFRAAITSVKLLFVDRNELTVA